MRLSVAFPPLIDTKGLMPGRLTLEPDPKSPRLPCISPPPESVQTYFSSSTPTRGTQRKAHGRIVLVTEGTKGAPTTLQTRVYPESYEKLCLPRRRTCLKPCCTLVREYLPSRQLVPTVFKCTPNVRRLMPLSEEPREDHKNQRNERGTDFSTEQI